MGKIATLFQSKVATKPVPFGVAHTYMAYIREPPLLPVQSLVVYLFLLARCLWTNASKHLPSWQVSKNSGSKGKGRVGRGERKRDACYKNPLSFVCQISYWLSHIE